MIRHEAMSGALPPTAWDPDVARQAQRRRTFAIISHPDAGKTTLTEKLLLFGGAIRLAGAVRAKSNQKHTTSDWMEIEKQRGISVSSSVLHFEYEGTQINLLDTPGHKDFSEDTYRTLTAADAAVMLIDAAKGVELQTRKLFEVCRMRGLPIFTFINKMDRPGREPLDLMDELERVLGIRSTPLSWPIGQGDRFVGVYDRMQAQVLVFQKEEEANVKDRRAPIQVSGLDDPKLGTILAHNCPEDAGSLHQTLREDLALLSEAGDPFDADRVLRGELSPLFFGSAMNNFGVEHFLRRFIEIAPPPRSRPTKQGGLVAAEQSAFSGLIFKIQANMDPAHRDRVAYMRVCSGRFTRNMSVRHVRRSQDIRLSKPLHFFAQDRVLIDEAWPGDIVGLLDTTGELRIGDTLCTGTAFEFEGVPRFSPEHFVTLHIADPLKRKQLKKGLEQLAEEGVVQIYRQALIGDQVPILGAVGVLQFEVLEHRLLAEYGVRVRMEAAPFSLCRWILGEPIPATLRERRQDSWFLEDRDGLPVLLLSSPWALEYAKNQHRHLQFSITAPSR